MLLGLQMSLQWYLSRDTVDAKLGRGVVNTARAGVATVKAGVNAVKVSGRVAKTSVKLAIRTIKLAIAAVRLLLVFLKVLVTVCVTIASSVALLFLLAVLVLIAAVSSYIVLIKDGGLPISSPLAGGFEAGGVAGASLGAGGSYMQSDGSVVNAIMTLGQWMIDDVAVYSQTSTVVCPYLSELDADGNIVTEGTMRPDCSGFAHAIVRYLANEKGYKAASSPVPLGGSSGYIVQNGAWCNKLESLGWVFLSSKDMQVSDLQAGDMMVRNGHVEFYMGEGKTWGWGTVQKQIPKNANVVKNGSEFMIWTTGGYTTIYRYIGSGASSSVE